MANFGHMGWCYGMDSCVLDLENRADKDPKGWGGMDFPFTDLQITISVLYEKHTPPTLSSFFYLFLFFLFSRICISVFSYTCTLSLPHILFTPPAPRCAYANPRSLTAFLFKHSTAVQICTFSPYNIAAFDYSQPIFTLLLYWENSSTVH